MSADTARALLLQILAWGALPAWLLAGLLDWLCHRRTRIEVHSGAPEAAMHVVLYALTAVPVLLGLYFEIDALTLLLMGVGVAAHTVVGWLDTGYTQPRRYIGALEQAVHAWLETLPVFAWVVIAALYASAWRSPQWTLHLREVPLPAGARYGIPLALLPGLALIIEELLRCRRSPIIASAAYAATSPSPGAP
jgi:hypothetical protein